MKRRHHSLALYAVLGASVLGAVLAPSIPSSVFPELVFPRAIILADSGELPPDQMLVSVTRPIASVAYSIVGTALVRSTTTRGAAEVDVTFAPSADRTTRSQSLSAALGD